jgi:hypothetical protein
VLFAALALMVASAGLYGRVVHSVVRRRREIGIRLAVGAPRQSIVGLFTADGSRRSCTTYRVGISDPAPFSQSFAPGRQEVVLT